MNCARHGDPKIDFRQRSIRGHSFYSGATPANKRLGPENNRQANKDEWPISLSFGNETRNHRVVQDAY